MTRSPNPLLRYWPLTAPLFAVLVACGGDSSQQTARTLPPALQRRVDVRDSIRERTNAMLERRPDTLGMRADSARVLGAPSASVYLVVTSDFQCPACRDFALNVLPEIREEFVDSGRIKLAFINNPQERYFNARFAALAALCAGTVGKFWQMHDALFVNQATWERMPDPRDFMNQLAVAAGVPAHVQADCISRNRMLHQLTTDIARSRETDVVEVPTVFVGDRQLESKELTVGAIRRAILRALGDR